MLVFLIFEILIEEYKKVWYNSKKTKKREKTMIRVGYLGPEATFTNMAVSRFFRKQSMYRIERFQIVLMQQQMKM